MTSKSALVLLLALVAPAALSAQVNKNIDPRIAGVWVWDSVRSDPLRPPPVITTQTLPTRSVTVQVAPGSGSAGLADALRRSGAMDPSPVPRGSDSARAAAAGTFQAFMILRKRAAEAMTIVTTDDSTSVSAGSDPAVSWTTDKKWHPFLASADGFTEMMSSWSGGRLTTTSTLERKASQTREFRLDKKGEVLEVKTVWKLNDQKDEYVMRFRRQP